MSNDLLGLAGRRVLVTAGANGIGWEIATQFASYGARVLVSDLDQKALSKVASTDVIGIHADASTPEGVQVTLEAVEHHLGGLDALVNNAGVAGSTAPIEEMPFSSWQSTMRINVDSQFLHIKHFLPLLRRSATPSIVNLSSAAGLRAFRERSPYAASKWAVVGLTKTAAAELGPEGIRVNAVCPGVIDGPRLDSVVAAKAEALGISIEESRGLFVAQTAMGIPSSAQDVGEAVLFLTSRMARTISGQVLSVDGFIERMA